MNSLALLRLAPPVVPPRARTLLVFTALSPVFAGLAAHSARAGGLPTGGAFVAGQGSIAETGNAMTITQQGQRGVINWQSFSIGKGNTVQINNGSGATLNRVTGSQMSQIAGKLGATGSVFLINPNGVVVAPGGRVIVDGSFTASSRDASNSQFMAGGAVTLSGTSTGAVANKGTIYAKDGSVTLIGQSVSNSGTIQADHGTVAMVAGDSVILTDKNEQDGIYVKTKAATKGDVTNSGRIQAASAELRSVNGNVYALAGNHDGVISASGAVDGQGGVYLTADNGAVSVSGTITARNADGSGGTIVANGHDVTIAGTATIDARSTVSGKHGGTILVGTSAKGGKHLAQTATLASGAKLLAGGQGAAGYIETSAHHLSTGALTVDAGVGGNWLTDPDDLTIDATAASTINSALAGGTNVTEQTTATGTSGSGTVNTAGNGDITVDAPLSWSSSAALTLSAFRTVNINSQITVSGAGQLNIVSDNNVGGTSSGGFFELSNGAIDFTTAGQGGLSINGTSYTLIWDVSGLYGIKVNPSGHYAIADNIDASGTSNFSPILPGSSFTGGLQGLNNAISNLTINSNASNVGLISTIGTSGFVTNLDLSNVNITATASGANGGALAGTNNGYLSGIVSSGTISVSGNAGGLVGHNTGQISYSNAQSVSVSGSGNNISVGGLVGLNSGSIANTLSSGSVSVASAATATNVGGLVGDNTAATISDSFSSATVSNGQNAGGLVGANVVKGTIQGSGATGAVSGAAPASNADLGGLVGYSDQGSTITNSYATGSVIATGSNASTLYIDAGGLVGFSNVANISTSYATGNVSVSTGSTSIPLAAGGLIGSDVSSNVTTSYAAGSASVSGASSAIYASGFTAQVGGTPSYSDDYFDTDTSRTTMSVSNGTTPAGITGLTTAELASELPPGFSDTVWANAGNQTTPYLLSDTTGNQTVYLPGSPTTPYALIQSATGLEQISSNLSGNYALGANIDMSSIANFSPIGESTPFSGIFNGLNYQISNLTINDAIDPYVGLFGQIGSTGVVKYLGLANAIISGSAPNSDVGGIAGHNLGLIDMVWATGDVFGTGNVGGLVGFNDTSGSIVYAGAANVVSGSASAGAGSVDVAGLVGENAGSISNSFAEGSVRATSALTNEDVGGLVGYNFGGSVSESFSTSPVSGSGATTYVDAGGLIGLFAGGSVTNSYAIGSVSASGTSGQSVGGLIGGYGGGGSVSDSYASGAVSGGAGANVGGFVGSDNGTVYTNDYYDTTSSNAAAAYGYSTQSSLSGITGVTTTELASALPTGFSSAIWGNLNNQTTPYLITDQNNTQQVYFGDSSTFSSSTPVNLIFTAVELQNINGNLSGNYALAQNIDAGSASNFTPIGVTAGNSAPFFGVLDGMGYTVSNLTINDNSDEYVGLFEAIGGGGVVKNLGLVNETINVNSANSYEFVGGIAGKNDGTLSNVYVSGISANVTNNIGSGNTYLDYAVGGLIGQQDSSGSIADTYSTGALNASGDGSGFAIGGLVGNTGGNISLSHSDVSVSENIINAVAGGLAGATSATITQSYATGNVVSAEGTSSGGLVGYSDSGTITESYATGDVTTSAGNHVGGFIGQNDGTISDAYSTGSVTGSSANPFGGFAGSSSQAITNSYFDTTTSGMNTGVGMGTTTGVTGLTTTQLASALPTGFSSSIWGNLGNQTTPYLTENTSNQEVYFSNNADFSQTTPVWLVFNSAGLQEINDNLSANYALANDIDASGISNFVPIGENSFGSSEDVFSGTFDGLGHTISNLTLSPNLPYVGLFAQNSGTVANLNLSSASIQGTTNANAIGTLVGINLAGGKISNVSGADTNINVTVTSGFGSGGSGLLGSRTEIGGLIGDNEGAVSYVSSTGNVTSTYTNGTIGDTGGLLGGSGMASSPNSANQLTSAYSGANVSSTVGGSATGGLIGLANYGTISQAYATGTVSLTGTGSVGGLIGADTNASIANAYALGAVTVTSGSFGPAALIGSLGASATLSNVYYDTDTNTNPITNNASGASPSGLTTAQLASALPSGFSSAIWGNLNDQTTPYLLNMTANQNVLSGENSVYGAAAGAPVTVITAASGLNAINDNLSGNWGLGQDIDAYGNTNFTPIAEQESSEFSGIFYGAGNTISNMTINDSTDQIIGLFGYIGSGSVSSLNIVNANVVGTATVGFGGILAGINAGTVSDVSVSGLITIPGHVGGLIGDNYGTVSGSSSSASVVNSSTTYSTLNYDNGNYGITSASTGGLVALNQGTINNSYATGTVNNGVDVGGLAGDNIDNGNIANSYATGAVSTDMTSSVQTGGLDGGLVGFQRDGLITNSYATGAVTLTGTSSDQAIVGGLVADNSTGSISGSAASGAISAQGAGQDYVGGLAGWNGGSIETSSASSAINETTVTRSTGGFVGYNAAGGSISDSFAYGAVTSNATSSTGGGWVGGFLGENYGTATGDAAYGDVNSGAAPSSIGGLIGHNYGSVSQSYSTGNVTFISNTNSSGGGLVGYTDAGSISDSYATGAVSESGTGIAHIGGLIGDVATSTSSPTISDAYSAGTVSSTGTGTLYIGSSIGYMTNVTPTDVYYDASTSGQSAAVGSLSGSAASTGITGLTTAQWITQGPTVSGSPYGFADASDWVAGAPYPVLSALPYQIVTVNGQSTYGTSPESSAWSNTGTGLSTAVQGYQTFATATSSVGSYVAWGTGASESGYQITYSGTDTVNPADLTITANSQSTTYGTAPTLSNSAFTVTGLVNGDAVSSVNLTTAATSASSVGAYAINASAAQGTGLSNYAISYAPGTLAIDPAALTITASNQSSIYGTTPALGSSAFATVGLVNGDSVSGVDLATAATSASNVGQYAITASAAAGSGLSNYAITYAPGILTVDPAALTVLANNQTMTYGDTPNLGTTAFTTSGLLNDDAVSSVLLLTAASKTSNVGGYGIAASGATGSGLGNYDIIYQGGTLSVDPASLTITAGNQSSVYGSTPALGSSLFSTAGLRNADTVTSVTLNTAAGAASAVGNYGITASDAIGSGLSNYTIAYAPGILAIDPAALTITAGNQAMTYGTAPSVDQGAYTVAGLLNSDAVSGVALATDATSASPVGAYTMIASAATGSGLSNYDITYDRGTMTVDPASLVVQANDRSMTYGTAPDLGTTGFVTTGLVNGDTVTDVSLTSAATKASSVGNYTIAASGAIGTGLSNYLISYQTGHLTIDPAALAITADDQSAVYGTSPTLGTAAFSTAGLVNGDVVSAVSLSTAATKTSGVGAYGIIAADATGSGLSNYAISYIPGTLTIDPAALLVTAGNQSATYGDTPSLGSTNFLVSGLVNGDQVSSVALATAATAGSNVGTYGITAANAVGSGLSNYAITYAPGTLTIDPAILTVAANDQSMVYGGVPTLGSTNLTVTGLKNSDTVTSADLTTAASSISSVGHYGIDVAAATGSGLANYTIAYAPGTLTIEPAALLVTAGDQSSGYGRSPDLGSTAFTATGLVNGDAVSGVDLTTAATSASAVGLYQIAATNAVGSGLGNYAISYAPGVLTIDPAQLSIAATDQSSIYGSMPVLSGSGFVTSGLLNGDTVTSVSLETAATGASPVGTYAITAASARGTGLSNYDISYHGGMLDIDPASLTIQGGTGSSVYGQVPGLAGVPFTVTGLVNGDTVTNVSRISTATAASAVGNYTVDFAGATGSGLSNYDIFYTPGVLTIDPATLTVTAGDQSAVYGHAPALGVSDFTSSGLVNGDTVSGVTLATSATQESSVGDYTINASNARGTGLSNYEIVYRNGSLTIDPATLTIAADAQSATYGTTPHLGVSAFTVDGLLNNDSVSSALLTTQATSASGVGSYGIAISNASGVGLSNYTIGYVPGLLTINPASLTIAADDQTSTYGVSPVVGGYTATGLVNGDSIASVNLATAATAASSVGKYAITASGATGTGLENYDIAYQTGDLSIDPASLLVAATGQSGIYGQGQAVDRSAYRVSGLVNGDTVTSVALSAPVSSRSPVGDYAISASNATGSGLSNYLISYQPGTYTIDPATLSISALAQSGTYGSTPVLGTTGFVARGLVNGDDVTGVTLSTAAQASSTVGAYGLGISGAQGAGLENYLIEYVPSTYEVTPAALTIIADPQTARSVASLNGSDWTASGLMNNDQVSAVTLQTNATTASGPGAYAITPSAAVMANAVDYDLTYVPGTLTLTGVSAAEIQSQAVTNAALTNALTGVVSQGASTMTGASATQAVAASPLITAAPVTANTSAGQAETNGSGATASDNRTVTAPPVIVSLGTAAAATDGAVVVPENNVYNDMSE